MHPPRNRLGGNRLTRAASGTGSQGRPDGSSSDGTGASASANGSSSGSSGGSDQAPHASRRWRRRRRSSSVAGAALSACLAALLLCAVHSAAAADSKSQQQQRSTTAEAWRLYASRTQAPPSGVPPAIVSGLPGVCQCATYAYPSLRCQSLAAAHCAGKRKGAAHDAFCKAMIAGSGKGASAGALSRLARDPPAAAAVASYLHTTCFSWEMLQDRPSYCSCFQVRQRAVCSRLPAPGGSSCMAPPCLCSCRRLAPAWQRVSKHAASPRAALNPAPRRTPSRAPASPRASASAARSRRPRRAPR